MIRKTLFWILMVVVIFFTRFYQLNSYPPSLTIDEVAIGYNAYSILKTGKDEWGIPFPVSFRSVGDYKAPILIYLTIPFIKFFGLSELGVRMPVAIFSAISVFLFWYLLKNHIILGKKVYLAYLATLIYSLSPWLIFYSRSGFEAVIALTFLLTNLIFAFKYQTKGRLTDFVLMFVFAYLAAISYHSTKIVVPLVNLFFIVSNLPHFRVSFKSWVKYHRYFLVFSAALFVFLAFFFIQNFILGSGSSRAQMTLLTKDFDYARVLEPKLNQSFFSSLATKVGLIQFWLKRYLEYFSANFYLFTGLGLVIPGHPGQGIIYEIEYVFLMIGFFAISILNKSHIFFSSRFTKNIILVWLIVGLIPASITNNSQHALRTLNVLPVMAILTTFGIDLIFSKITKFSLKTVFTGVLFFGYIYGLSRFADYYLIHYPFELSEFRSYGWKQIAIFANTHQKEYESIFIDPRFGTEGPYTFGVPYMYFLFYSQYDPKIYQNNIQRITGGTDFENYKFLEINWQNYNHPSNNLFIGSPWSFPLQSLRPEQIKLQVNFLNGKPGLYAISD